MAIICSITLRIGTKSDSVTKAGTVVEPNAVVDSVTAGAAVEPDAVVDSVTEAGAAVEPDAVVDLKLVVTIRM